MTQAAHSPSPATPQVVATMAAGVVDASTPVVLADDLGLTRGDGVFDATRIRLEPGRDAVVDHLDRHLDRFAHSIELLEGEAPDLDAWRALIADAVAAWQVPGEAVLKIMWTRGLESTHGDATELLTITPISPATLAQRQGMKICTLDRGYASDAFIERPWLLGGAKTLSYGVNVAAKREASRRGADDVLFTSSDGYCLEGPTSSLIAQFGRRLLTTPLDGTGILASITQHLVWEAASADGWETGFELMRPAQLHDADNVWVVSSVRGVSPVLELDGVALRHDPAMNQQMNTWAGF